MALKNSNTIHIFRRHGRKILLGVVTVLATAVALSAPSAMVLVTAQISPIPEEHKLRAHKEDILASKRVMIFVHENGLPVSGTGRMSTFYAYKSDIQITDNVPSSNILAKVEKRNLQIVGEDVSARQRNARTFLTNKENTYISEFISGHPQYHEDSDGIWWQIDYATTTEEAFNQQMGLIRAYVAYADSNTDLTPKF